MNTKIARTGIFILLFSTPFTLGRTVSLLPLQQAEVHPSRQLSTETMVHDLLQRLTALPEMQMVPFDELTEAYEDRLLEDAVFEIIVTDELHRTLSDLDTWESTLPWSQKLVALAEQSPVDTLVDITIKPQGRQWRVTYTLIDVQAKRPVCTRSFTEVSHDPMTVSREIAKYVTRSLWQVEQRGIND